MKMNMNISNVFSARNVTLFVFILFVLFLGATFNVQVGPESFEELQKPPAPIDINMTTTTNMDEEEDKDYKSISSNK